MCVLQITNVLCTHRKQLCLRPEIKHDRGARMKFVYDWGKTRIPECRSLDVHRKIQIKSGEWILILHSGILLYADEMTLPTKIRCELENVFKMGLMSRKYCVFTVETIIRQMRDLVKKFSETCLRISGCTPWIFVVGMCQI